MTTSDNLKLYAVRYRWAYEELVADAKFQEWNNVASSKPEKQLRWLVRYHGGLLSALKSIRVLLQLYKCSIPDLPEILAYEKYRILSEELWALEESVYNIKVEEIKKLRESVQSMFLYLVSVHGSAGEVLRLLQWIVRVQDGRRKTLFLDT